MSPLMKRLPREFRHNLGKYLGIFLLFLFAIMMGSGFLSAAYSIQVLQEDMHGRHQVEDFHFATQFEAARASIEAVEVMGCTVHEDFTADVPLLVAGDERANNCRLINHRSFMAGVVDLVLTLQHRSDKFTYLDECEAYIEAAAE